MGVCQSWIAIKGHSQQEVLAALGLRPTGGREDFAESPRSAALLPSGFYLVVFGRTELTASKLRQYSASLDLLFGFVEEHVMFSTVAAWRDSEELWSVVHDAQKGILHLEVNGSPPASFAAIRDRMIAEQKGEDLENPEVDHIFDIPVQLGADLMGYRHDEEVRGLSDEAFEVLEPVKQGMFGRWNPFKK